MGAKGIRQLVACSVADIGQKYVNKEMPTQLSMHTQCTAIRD